MNCKIAHIEYYLPEKKLTNQELARENPDWDIEALIGKTGVVERRIAVAGQTALDLGYQASRKLLDKVKIDAQDIDGVIFCTQSPDYIMPGNAFVLHDRLGLSDRAMAFDVNLACSGYIYGLAMAQAFINTFGYKNILLVTADTYSKYIHPQDKSVRLLFGDGAAATLLVPSAKGVLSVDLGSYGKGFSHFMIEAGGCRLPKSESTAKVLADRSGNRRSAEHILMEGFALVSLARARVAQSIRGILKSNNLTNKDIKLFIFHQASQLVLDSLQKSLEIPPEKMFNNLKWIGNTVSSSLPIALKDALDHRLIKKGDKIVLCGFGVGFSWGSIILEWA